jgi:hypothetical protein
VKNSNAEVLFVLLLPLLLQVGSERTFDAGVYSKAVESNRQQQAASNTRNFVGGGDILAFQP